MAKINGIEVKSLKGFTGHEGYCYQGNVYKDGKKLGFWSQDAWGGSDSFDFDTSVFKEVLKDYKDGFPDGYKYKDYCDNEDIFMAAVVDLKCIEKDCKKAFKDGWKAVYYVNDRFHYSWLPLPEVLTVSEVAKKYPDQVKQMASQMFKSGYTEYVFTPDSFDLTIDKNNPAPAYMTADA